MFAKALFRGFLATAVVAFAVVAQAVNIELVPVGNAGNAGQLSGTGAPGNAGGPARPDTGAVNYDYWIGKYEVTAQQYCDFLNLKAKTDSWADGNTLWVTNMGGTVGGGAATGCGILRSGNPGDYSYTVVPGNENRALNFVSFWAACRFANWMNNGQGTADTETGAYTLTTEGITQNTITRNATWTWALPSEDEWYKAAYHKNDGVTGNYWQYPTKQTGTMPGRDMTEAMLPGNNMNSYVSPQIPYPIDGASYLTNVGEFELSVGPYGTFDQGGNVGEWTNEIIGYSTSDPNYPHDRRNYRGGAFSQPPNYSDAAWRTSMDPVDNTSRLGFRLVASVPEPGSVAMLLGAVGGLLVWWRRKRVA